MAYILDFDFFNHLQMAKFTYSVSVKKFRTANNLEVMVQSRAFLRVW